MDSGYITGSGRAKRPTNGRKNTDPDPAKKPNSDSVLSKPQHL
jgi:hypothetical protein